MERLTLKTSVIFVTRGNDTRVFRSIEEVPPELRRELAQSTKGMNSATILIADRGGREELSRALGGGSSRLHSRLISRLTTSAALSGRRLRELPLRVWGELLLAGGLGLAIWTLLALR